MDKDLKIRQLENDLSFLERKTKAIEKQYAKFRNRSFIALMATKRGGKWQGEVSFVENTGDSVQANNYLRNLTIEIAKEMGSDYELIKEDKR